MMISRVARVNSSHPYLENDSSSSLVSHRLRISPWLWFSTSLGNSDSDARAKTLPAWFQELARKVDSNILPNFRQVDEARMLAGWSEAVMRQAVQKYVQVYRGKTVNAPETLFRKLAIEAARKAPASTSGDELPKYAADQRRRRGSR